MVGGTRAGIAPPPAGAGYDRALALNPRLASAANNRANVWKVTGNWQASRGEDPQESYRAALAGYDRALELNPGWAQVPHNKASVHKALGDWQRGRGEDPRENYRAALACCDRALALDPSVAEVACDQANVHAALGDWQANRGEDPQESYRAALAGYDRALRLNPGLWQAHAMRGRVLPMMDQPDQAVAALEAALALRPGEPQLVAWLRQATHWQRLARAGRTFEHGESRAALTAFEDAIAALDAELAGQTEAERRRLLADPGWRALLAGAHYGLACALAWASAGQDVPRSPAAEAPGEDAARRCAEAFAHIDRALEFGRDGARLVSDPALAPLHADPRWPDLLARIGQRKKD